MTLRRFRADPRDSARSPEKHKGTLAGRYLNNLAEYGAEFLQELWVRRMIDFKVSLGSASQLLQEPEYRFD
ncbi:MAG: hypothetical protein JJU13_13960 [Balneolaceae bacterium]|nr:hypothetical protein [Balneolaceae bacterium]